MPAAVPVEAPSRWVVDKDAKRRVEDVLDQIAASGAYGGSQVLRVGAAEQRAGARVTAVRLARRSGRTALVLQGRDEIRTAMAARYARFNVGMVFGSSGDLSTGRERVEIAIALEDLVLATAVQDLLGFDDLATLSSDGSSLLHDLPRASMFPSVSYAPASAAGGGTRGSVRTMQITVVAVLVVGSLIVGGLFGIVPALIGGCLTAAIVASWIWRPGGDDEPQERETP